MSLGWCARRHADLRRIGPQVLGAFNQRRETGWLGPNDFSKKAPITYGRKIIKMLDAIYIRLLKDTIAQKMMRYHST